MSCILIVDDERSIRRTLGEFLRGEGYEVIEAEDADAALRELQDRSVDVVISDIVLPRVSGVQLLQRIHGIAPYVQVVMMTGEPTVETAAESLRAGAMDYLFKPISKAAILRVAATATRLKILDDARRRLEAENRNYQQSLERLVDERTRQLRASEEQAQELFRFNQAVLDSLTAHICVLAEDGEIVAVNRAWEEFRAANPPFARNAGVGANYLEICARATGEDLAASQETIRGLKAVGAGALPEFTLEYPCHSPETERWFMMRASRFVGEGAVRIVIAHVNITARKAAEEATRRSEERYRSLVESLPQHVFRKDFLGRFTFGNGSFCRSLGKALDEVIGKTDFDFYDATLAAKYREDDQRVLETGLPYHGEEEHQLPDGRVLWVDVVKLPLRDAHRRISGLQGISWDITERRRTETALRNAESLYHSLLEHLPQCVFRKDLTGRFTYVNQNFCTLMGRNREELIGRTDFDFFLPELAESYHRDDERVLAAQQVVETVDERLPVGGKPTAVFHVLRAPVRTASGEVIGVQGIYTDITSQRELEAKFLRAQRLESVGSLASGIAHDLNNILTPILMCSPLVAAEESAQNRLEMAQTIESSAQRAVEIVKQLLSFSRGKESKKSNLQLRHLVRDLCKIARETFPRDIQIEDDCDAELWPVIGNPTQLHQVLLNLCVNARDAMPSGGRLTIRARNLMVDQHFVAMHAGAEPGPYVHLQVKDTGTGIPDAVQAHIFESFFTTKEEGQGTGLGLTVAHGIIQDHQGFITFTSTVGRGTTFDIHLPATGVADAGNVPARRADAPPRGQGELVLVVDDEPSVCDATRRTLEGYGYVVIQARDGIDALAQFSSHPHTVKAVLSDVLMPMMDGVTLCRTLRRLSPKTPLIVSSGGLFGRVGTQALAAFEEMGIRHILHKPHNAEVLLAALHDALQGA